VTINLDQKSEEFFANYDSKDNKKLITEIVERLIEVIQKKIYLEKAF